MKLIIFLVLSIVIFTPSETITCGNRFVSEDTIKKISIEGKPTDCEIIVHMIADVCNKLIARDSYGFVMDACDPFRDEYITLCKKNRDDLSNAELLF